MAKIVLASHNQGKLRELREILRGRIDGLNVETDVVDASAVHAPDVPETGVSFAENSLIKARAIAEATGLIAVSRRLWAERGRAGRGTRYFLGALVWGARGRHREP